MHFYCLLYMIFCCHHFDIFKAGSHPFEGWDVRADRGVARCLIAMALLAATPVLLPMPRCELHAPDSMVHQKL